MTGSRRSSRQGWRFVLAAAIAVGGVMTAQGSGGALASTPEPHAAQRPADQDVTTRVIVRAAPGRLEAAAAAVRRLAGRVITTQHALGTLVADVPAAAVRDLREASGVHAVTPDAQLRLLSNTVGPTGLPGDMTNVARLTGATAFWRNGFTGQGVDVALLDSGVLPVSGLSTPNKLVLGPDLSFESQVPSLSHLDTFGHGTHMAGIIAGLDSGVSLASVANNNNDFVGMAPGSRLVSLKLADALGQTDVSQVIAAIDWVVTHAKSPGLNIRVLNLSFGTDTTQSWRLDPLAHAAEVAWHRGIVVVAAGGNGDGSRSGLSNPAYDPTIMAVGAVDTKGTAERADDVIPAFSQRGSTADGLRGPDVVAPGSSIVSLRAPASHIDVTYGSAGRVADRFFKGSGTSQAAAVVSGAAALLLSQRPSLSPDQVRDILRRSAAPLADVSIDAQGAGAIDLARAYSTARTTVAPSVLSPGGGSLEASRGRFHVRLNGAELTGEKDIFGRAADTVDLAADEALGATWTGGSYNGATWTGSGWLGPVANGATWTGATWTGATWTGATWTGATWTGATWTGATWTGATWTGATWTGATWTGATWTGATWTNALWATGGWQ